MAVRVVKLKPKSDLVREVICPHCEATPEYISSDVQAAYGSDHSLMPSTRYWVVCANKGCEKSIAVPSKCW